MDKFNRTKIPTIAAEILATEDPVIQEAFNMQIPGEVEVTAADIMEGEDRSLIQFSQSFLCHIGPVSIFELTYES